MTQKELSRLTEGDMLIATQSLRNQTTQTLVIESATLVDLVKIDKARELYYIVPFNSYMSQCFCCTKNTMLEKFKYPQTKSDFFKAVEDWLEEPQHQKKPQEKTEKKEEGISRIYPMAKEDIPKYAANDKVKFINPYNGKTEIGYIDDYALHVNEKRAIMMYTIYNEETDDTIYPVFNILELIQHEEKNETE